MFYPNNLKKIKSMYRLLGKYKITAFPILHRSYRKEGFIKLKCLCRQINKSVALLKKELSCTKNYLIPFLVNAVKFQVAKCFQIHYNAHMRYGVSTRCPVLCDQDYI